jgi:thiosulfate/3-mercaptopyruvate sulfurtransferase
MLASLADVTAAVEGRGGQIVDARAPERYRGEVEPIDKVAGHIPSAVNRFFKANLNPDLTLRTPAELRADFVEILANREPREIIHQCGSGITACVNLLAMECAGLNGSRLYAGSWSEWSADPARPMVTAKT